MQTSLCSAASTRTPPAKGSRRTINLRTKPAQSETNNSPLHESFVSLFFVITGFPKQDSSSRTVRNCPHAGRAVASATPSDWYYLEPKLYRTLYVCQLSPQTNLCSAASTRTPPAKGSQRTINLRTKAHSKRNEQFAVARIVRFSLFRNHGLSKTRQFIADSTELPSRRAGGASGHSVRVVLPRTEAIPYTLRLLVVDANKPLLRREHADAARAGQSEND